MTDKKFNTYILITSIVILTLTALGINQYEEKQRYKRYLTAVYEKSLHGAAQHTENINTLLKKVSILEYPEQAAPIYAEIWQQSAFAHDYLTTLPYNQNNQSNQSNYENVLNASKYLSQLSDFSHEMMIKSLEGSLCSEEDNQNIKLVSEYSKKLSDELHDIIKTTRTTGVNWDFYNQQHEKQNRQNGQQNGKEEIVRSREGVLDQFSDYPDLVHSNKEYTTITDSEYITIDNGIDIAINILNDFDIKNIKFIGETPETDSISQKKLLPAYSYEITLQGSNKPEIYIDITKKGGFPLWMINSQEIESSEFNITFKEAFEIAESFLKNSGFESMKHSYYEKSDDCIIINYVSYIDGVIMYPDLIKVKLSLKDGTLLGFEALGYIQSHHERDIPTPNFSKAEALVYISPKLDIKEINTALIPKGSYVEELCYEYDVENNAGERFLIYINAITGKTEAVYTLNIGESGVFLQ